MEVKYEKHKRNASSYTHTERGNGLQMTFYTPLNHT